MSAYLIIEIEITDQANFMRYVSEIPAFIIKHHGQYIVEGVTPELMEGNRCPERMVIIAFPSVENAKSFMSDPDIQSVFTIRQNSTNSNIILARGGSWRDEL